MKSPTATASAPTLARLIRDKLWFYTAWRRQTDGPGRLATFMPDALTPAVARSCLVQHERSRIRCRRRTSSSVLRLQPQLRYEQPEPVHSLGATAAES